MATAATAPIDPASGLRQKVIASLGGNATSLDAPLDPTASTAGTDAGTAPFVQQPTATTDNSGQYIQPSVLPDPNMRYGGLGGAPSVAPVDNSGQYIQPSVSPDPNVRYGGIGSGSQVASAPPTLPTPSPLPRATLGGGSIASMASDQSAGGYGGDPNNPTPISAPTTPPSTASTSFTNTSTVTPPAGVYAPGGGQVDQPGVDYSQSGDNFNTSAWVTSALNQAKSTDDPNYWNGKIANDPNVQNPATRDSALAYWQGRINEGDGNGLGNPTLPPETTPAPTTTTGGDGGGSSTSGTGDPSFDAYLQSLQSQQAARDAQQAQLRQIIMGRIAADSQPVDETAPYIAAPLSAARDEASRSQDAERTALAEQLYAQGAGGLNSNDLTMQIQQSAEKNAGSLSNLRAGLISQEYTARRTEINNLLQTAMAQGDTQSAQQLQAELSALNAQLQQTGMGIGLSEFGAQLNQNAALAGLSGT